ncbi:MAG: GNAT family N-acetyltransferase [Sphingobacterium sp.]
MISETFPILTTERLHLRQIQDSDAPALFSYFSKDEVTLYFDLPTFQHLDEAYELVKTWQKNFLEKEAIRWAICLKDNPDQLIGSCGFHNFSTEHFRAEIGYELHPDFWQQGIMTEAISAIISFGFDSYKLNRIEAFIDPDNLASRRLLEKMNLVSEGILHDYFFEKGRFVDGEIFALLKKNYSQPTPFRQIV